MNGSGELLSAAEVDSLRESIRDAVLGAPTGMSTALQDDPQAYLRLVAATRTAAEETSRLLREAIDGARHAGHSWDTLGQLLGVSRQAAQQRFASPVNTLGHVQTLGVQTPGNEPARKVLTPLTAFDEMAVLEQQGRLGWHVVDYGTLHHIVEASPWQWEHRRVLGSVGARRHHLEDEGWQLIKTMWFPWAYYKRCLNIPAEPDTAAN
jgi:hypothetical protein